MCARIAHIKYLDDGRCCLKGFELFSEKRKEEGGPEKNSPKMAIQINGALLDVVHEKTLVLLCSRFIRVRAFGNLM